MISGLKRAIELCELWADTAREEGDHDKARLLMLLAGTFREETYRETTDKVVSSVCPVCGHTASRIET